MNKSTVYEYADGNGNTYRIQASSLEYVPVKKEESSSGMYSGGEARTVAINAEQYRDISALIESALNNTGIHINDRVMMSGVVRAISSQNTRSCIIKPGSDELIGIEQALAEMMGRE
ncbi:MAG TPA: hypothetical protein VK589_20685 [Chryseolinea sp.]|nr:hypothetical protein [Chryseolinea sp.]